LIMAVSALGQSLMTRHTRREVTSGQAKFLYRLPGGQVLRLDLVLPLRDPAGLESFLAEVYDPASPNYRQFLTVPAFTERFGPTQQDYDAAVAFAKARGFQVVGGSRDGMEVQVEGSIAAIEAAFNVSMGVYQHPTENRTFYAPDREPSVALPFRLWNISGLDNFSTPHPALVQRKADVQPAATTGSGTQGSYLGSDMRAAYYGGTLTGTGQSVGLFEFYGIDTADVKTYYANVGQTDKVPITLISTDGTSTGCLYSASCDDTQSVIDVIESSSMAPAMSGLYLFVGKSATAILSSMTTHSPLSAQLSCSWFWSPADPTADDPYFERMAAQGQNFFAAAGDDGEWTTNIQTHPADDAYVVSVGGTSLTTSFAAGPWASETAWPDGGGGVSPHNVPIPTWQAATGVINSDNGGSPTYRNGPDVSANSAFSYYICADQNGCSANLLGGTSFAAPIWAGYLALVNQQSKTNGHPVLGFLNPLIYPLGLGANYNTYFHDVTTGNNIIEPSGSPGYPAVVGYDLATGWGSPNGAGLVNVLSKGASPAANFSIEISPSSVTVAQGGSGSVVVSPLLTGGFDAAVTLSVSGLPGTAPNAVTGSFNPITLPAPGSGSSTLTLDVPSVIAPGTYTLIVTGSGSGITHTATFKLIVTPPPQFTLTPSPGSISVAEGASGTSTITSTIATGFDAAITLSASVSPTVTNPPTVGFSPNPLPLPGNGTVTMTVSVPATTPTGKYTISVTGMGGGYTGTSTVTLTVTAPANLTVSATPTALSVAPGYSGTSKITTAISGPFNSTVTLSASGQPSGVTVSFNPATITAPGSGTSTMSMAVATTTTPGTYPITVTATGGSLAPTTTVNLTVTTGFALTPSPTTLNVSLGSSGTSKITSTVSGGFNATVSLSNTVTPPAGGSVSGITVSFNPVTLTAPGSGSSTMSVAVASTTTTGTYTITVTGTGGDISNTATVTLNVVAGPSFTISPSLTSVSVAEGSSGTSTITPSPSGGFNSSITLSASGQPSGVTVSFSPNPMSASGSSTMTMTVGSSVPANTYSITVTGTSGSITATTTVSLTVTTTGGGGSGGSFSLSASPASVSLAWGGSTTSTITTTVASGFSAPISLSASGLPSQVVVSFSPGTIAAPGSGTSTMQISVHQGAPVGTTTFTVTGSGGGKTFSTTVTLNIRVI
jgi:uncharacterized membrane protein